MKKLTIIFTTNHTDTLGNACRLEMVRFLTNSFEASIVTNQTEFVKSLNFNSKIFDIIIQKKLRYKLWNNIYWKSIAKRVNQIPSDLVFMFDDDSPATLWIKAPVIQYVHQYGLRSLSKGNYVQRKIKKLIAQRYDDLKVKGLKKSILNFVVSFPIIEILNNKGIRNTEYISHALDLELYQHPFLSQEHEKLQKLKAQGYFLITYTGWITENRGYQLMLDSLQKTVKQDTKIVLVLAGADEKYSHKIKVFCEENNLQNNIIDFGIIHHSLIPGILYYSDVCISFLGDVPAYHISPPQKVIEYFAAGKPVICNKIEPHEWLIKNGVNGYVLEYNSDEISDAILRLLRTPYLIKMMSFNARKESMKFDITVVYGKMVKKIQELKINFDSH